MSTPIITVFCTHSREALLKKNPKNKPHHFKGTLFSYISPVITRGILLDKPQYNTKSCSCPPFSPYALA